MSDTAESVLVVTATAIATAAVCFFVSSSLMTEVSHIHPVSTTTFLWFLRKVKKDIFF